MARYKKNTISAGGPNPPEWGTLSAAEVARATLMVHERRGDRYIPKDDVERLEGKGWRVVGKDYNPPAEKKPARTKARASA